MAFDDRTDAGRQLAEALEEREIDADIVLAIPRGGLPLGREVADALGVPLDIVVAKKMGAPHNPELAIGSVASDGSVWLNESLIEDLGVDDDYIEDETQRVAEKARQKLEKYRGDREAPDLEGKTVVIVDDGVATGATAIPCIRHVKKAGAEKTVLAVPVGSPDTVERLGDEADKVVAVETPASFRAVGQFYSSFRQVTDDEAREYLEY
ncbi:MAG: phosphoribosyltransferase [Halobacteria archaeon]|nr:phosphoribosyltransferase [Halobacteria archaeon]